MDNSSGDLNLLESQAGVVGWVRWQDGAEKKALHPSPTAFDAAHPQLHAPTTHLCCHTPSQIIRYPPSPGPFRQLPYSLVITSLNNQG